MSGAAAQMNSYKRGNLQVSFNEPDMKKTKTVEVDGVEIKQETDDVGDGVKEVSDDELLEIVSKAHQEGKLSRISNNLRKNLVSILK